MPATDLWDGHQLLMTEQDDTADLARWAARGLVCAEKLLYAADDRHPDAASLVATLAGHGVDAAGAAVDGRLAVLAPARFYDLAGYERLVEQGLSDGHSGGVRSLGRRVRWRRPTPPAPGYPARCWCRTGRSR